MATNETDKLAIQTREYFDRRAPTWDRNPGVSPEHIAYLNGVIQQLRPRQGDTVLDIGCGTGVLLPLLIPKVGRAGRIIAIDLSSKMLYLARQNVQGARVHFAHADATVLPLTSASVDLCHMQQRLPPLQ